MAQAGGGFSPKKKSHRKKLDTKINVGPITTRLNGPNDCVYVYDTGAEIKEMVASA